MRRAPGRHRTQLESVPCQQSPRASGARPRWYQRSSPSPSPIRKYSGGVVSTVVTTCHMPLSDPPAPCTVSASSAQKLWLPSVANRIAAPMTVITPRSTSSGGSRSTSGRVCGSVGGSSFLTAAGRVPTGVDIRVECKARQRCGPLAPILPRLPTNRRTLLPTCWALAALALVARQLWRGRHRPSGAGALAHGPRQPDLDLRRRAAPAFRPGRNADVDAAPWGGAHAGVDCLELRRARRRLTCPSRRLQRRGPGGLSRCELGRLRPDRACRGARRRRT